MKNKILSKLFVSPLFQKKKKINFIINIGELMITWFWESSKRIGFSLKFKKF